MLPSLRRQSPVAPRASSARRPGDPTGVGACWGVGAPAESTPAAGVDASRGVGASRGVSPLRGEVGASRCGVRRLPRRGLLPFRRPVGPRAVLPRGPLDTPVSGGYDEPNPRTDATGRSQDLPGWPRRRRADRRLRPPVARTAVGGDGSLPGAARRWRARPGPVGAPRVAGPLLRHLPQRPATDREPLVRGRRLPSRGSRDRGVGEGNPQAAVGDDAAGRPAAPRARPIRVLRRLAGSHHRPGRRRRPASGPADGAASQSDRVHQRDPGPAGAGDRRPRPVAARRHGVRLRQQRGHAADVAGAARALPVGGRENQPAGRRRPRPPPVGDHLQRLAAPVAGRQGRSGPAVREPRRRRRPALLPPRRRVRRDCAPARTPVARDTAARPASRGRASRALPARGGRAGRRRRTGRRGRPAIRCRSASAWWRGPAASGRRSSRRWWRPRG